MQCYPQADRRTNSSNVSSIMQFYRIRGNSWLWQRKNWFFKEAFLISLASWQFLFIKIFLLFNLRKFLWKEICINACLIPLIFKKYLCICNIFAINGEIAVIFFKNILTFDFFFDKINKSLEIKKNIGVFIAKIYSEKLNIEN